MRSSLKVGRAFGVPIFIHVTFLLILPLFVFIFGFTNQTLFGFPVGFGGLPLDDLSLLILGLVASLVFFASVLIHELAHSYVALKNGYKISGITLFIFGGVSEIEETPPEAPGEALMAFVGPGASFLLGAIFILLALAFRAMGDGLIIDVLDVGFGLVGVYNVLLGAFNIIPAFPMDGGRILRAVLVKRLGFVRATEVAANVGKGLAVVMAVVGLFINPFLILIALFIYIGAGQEERGTKLSKTMEGITVGDIMTKEVSTVNKNDTVRTLLEKMMAERHVGFPVVEGDQVVGMVSLADATAIPTEQQDRVLVASIMHPQFSTVTPQTEAIEAVKMVSNRGVGRLPVLENGRLVGIVSRTDLMRTLEIRSADAAATGASIAKR